MAKGEHEYADFVFERFPQELKNAYLAWNELSKKEREDSITSPFFMEEYFIPELQEAKEYEKQAIEFKKQANEADQNSDSYLLLSVILSIVLFFCGIVGVTDSIVNKRVLLGIAMLIFIVATVFVARLPFIF